MDNKQIKWSGDIRYVESNSEKILESGGVYKILRNDGKQNKFTRIYVGKAEDLKSRYLNHLSASEENSCIKNNLNNNECYFRYTVLSREVDRQNLEVELLRKGKYECNMQGQ